MRGWGNIRGHHLHPSCPLGSGEVPLSSQELGSYPRSRPPHRYPLTMFCQSCFIYLCHLSTCFSLLPPLLLAWQPLSLLDNCSNLPRDPPVATLATLQFIHSNEVLFIFNLAGVIFEQCRPSHSFSFIFSATKMHQ